jgi:hypothetical protein
MRMRDTPLGAVRALLASYRLDLVQVDDDVCIPGSYWGECEAGLQGHRLLWRADTPLHSLLHEASHFICMDALRRRELNRDAGGDDREENAVCYLQILLAEAIEGFGSERMCRDMDAWGYTFRLGSADAWFTSDAGDARQWLLRHDIIDPRGKPTGRRREG